MADRDIITEAEALYVVCYEHLVTDRLQRAFTHLHPAYASQFSLLKREYLRFIVLKLLEKDTGAQPKLSPSKAVDDLWHTHMLDSAAYEAFCWSINNDMLIHHNLLGMLDSAEEKQQRYAATYKLYELAFPPTPVVKIWPAPIAAATSAAPATPTTAAAAPAVVSLEPAAGTAASDANAGSSRNSGKKRSAAEALQDEQPAGSSSGSDSTPNNATLADAQEAATLAEKDEDPRITISVRACNGEAKFFNVRPHAKMSKVFNAYAANTEVQVTSLGFWLDGDRINGEATVQELELKDDEP